MLVGQKFLKDALKLNIDFNLKQKNSWIVIWLQGELIGVKIKLLKNFKKEKNVGWNKIEKCAF